MADTDSKATAQGEEALAIEQLLSDLAGTPFICSSLSRLLAGTTNYVYRGNLIQPHVIGSTLVKTVIIKHTKPHAPGNESFPLDISRGISEVSILSALRESPYASKAPRAFLSNQHNGIIVLEDLAHTIDLKTALVSKRRNEVLTFHNATIIGTQLGTWLRSFHEWTTLPEQAALRTSVEKNQPMRELKYKVTYGSFIGVLEELSMISDASKQTFESIRDNALFELSQYSANDISNSWGISHGDFWTGNVLISNELLSEPVWPQEVEFHIIDWEFVQFSPKAYDLGQMIGDIYERKHFHDLENATVAIEAFIESYGKISSELAFRTAIHIGVYLLGWYRRRAPWAPVKGTPTQIGSLITISQDLIIKGWQQDITWFQKSFIAPLFRSCS